MEGRKRAQAAIKTLLEDKQDKPRLYPANLGAYVAGFKTLRVAARPDFVWCRMRGGNAEIIQAFNDVVGLHWDLPIMVYRDPNTPAVWRIYGRDIAQYDDWDGASYIPPHGASHSFSQSPKTGVDPVWVFKRQFMPMLVRPIATGSMGVYIEPDFWYWGGHYNWWPGSGVAISNAYRPTGALNAAFVTIYMDGATETPALLKGPEFPAWFPPSDPGDYISVPSPSVGVPVAAAFITTGTSFIGWGEIYDLRLPVAAQNDQLTTGSITFMDEGFVAGQAPQLNVVGSEVSLTISGSVAMFKHTPPQEQIGIMVWDAGIPVGTGTIFDLGDSLDVSISGSVIQLNARGGSGNDIFFCYVTGSDVATYLKLLDTPSVGALQTITLAGIGATGTVAVFLTEPGVPNLDFIPDGIWDLHIHALQSAGTKTTKLRAEFFKRTAGGVETVFETSSIGSFDLTGAEIEYDLSAFLNSHTVAITDRIGVKALAVTSGGGSAPTVQVKIEGTTEARLTFPVNTLSAAVLNVQDDGLLLGSIRTIDFGSNLSATVSGTVARVDAAAGGGGGGGVGTIMNWDDGVPLGTGTIIDWGDNLDASISGSVLRVDSYVNIYDEGVFLSKARKIDYTGAGVTSTIVGDHVQVAVAGGSPTLELEGFVTGTFNTLDLVDIGGSLSGTIGRLARYEDDYSGWAAAGSGNNRWYYGIPSGYNGTTHATFVAGNAYAYPFFVGSKRSVDALAVHIGTASLTGTFARVAIYSDLDGQIPYPFKVVAGPLTLQTNVNAVISAPLQTTWLYPGRLYWMVAYTSSGTPQFKRMAGNQYSINLLGQSSGLGGVDPGWAYGPVSMTGLVIGTNVLNEPFPAAGAIITNIGLVPMVWMRYNQIIRSPNRQI